MGTESDEMTLALMVSLCKSLPAIGLCSLHPDMIKSKKEPINKYK